MRWRWKSGSAWGCCYFVFAKKTAKPFVRCHVFAPSAPGRHSNDKYPVQHFAPLLVQKCFTRSFYLLATVIHIQYVRSHICVYTKYSQYRDAGRANEMTRVIGSPTLSYVAHEPQNTVGFLSPCYAAGHVERTKRHATPRRRREGNTEMNLERIG